MQSANSATAMAAPIGPKALLAITLNDCLIKALLHVLSPDDAKEYRTSAPIAFIAQSTMRLFA